jgi:hypothetical protein
MLKHLQIVVSLAVIILCCNSCILEERELCPTYLTIDMSMIDRNVEQGHIWFFDSDGNLLYKDTVSRGMFNKPYVVKIPRDDYAKCYMWANMGKNTLLNEEYSLNTSLTVLDNKPADSIYFYSCDINTNREFSNLTLLANKEFATINLTLTSYCDTTAYNTSIIIECRSRGFLVDKSFIETSSRVKAQLCETGVDYSLFATRILRQTDIKDIKLYVTISPKNDSRFSEVDNISAIIPIGQYLTESGYDMYEENLSDISMELDIVGCFLSIKGEDWKEEKKFYVKF